MKRKQLQKRQPSTPHVHKTSSFPTKLSGRHIIEQKNIATSSNVQCLNVNQPTTENVSQSQEKKMKFTKTTEGTLKRFENSKITEGTPKKVNISKTIQEPPQRKNNVSRTNESSKNVDLPSPSTLQPLLPTDRNNAFSKTMVKKNITRRFIILENEMHFALKSFIVTYYIHYFSV